ncbi:MAG: hypothetical protein KDA37_01285 [Planctomycetales bacterium]|nr:hypothetical protein [Planctomycetales bacterium]
MPGSERRRELRRRRKRHANLAQLKSRLPKATASEKTEIARKLREMTPGAEQLIKEWELVEVDR